MAEQGTNRSGLSWPRPRFSIRSLIWATTFVAMLFPTAWFAWFLLLNASTAWGTHAVLGTAVLLAIAAAIALSRDGATRAFWSGFAAVGFVHFLLVVCNIAHAGGGGYYLFDSEKLVTSHWNQWVYRECVMPKLMPMPPPVGPGSPAWEDFKQVAHSLWTLLFACAGGLVSLAIWATGRPQSVRGVENGQC